MGLHDREYMQEEGAGFSVRRWYTGLSLTGKLLLANVLVFVLWHASGFESSPNGSFAAFMEANFMVDGERVASGRVWTLFTSGFSHIGIWHILFNLLFLWIFLPDLEQLYGRKNALALYLFGALGCSLGHLALSAAVGLDAPMLGASGAVMAIVVVSALLFPHKTLHIWGILPVPLWLLAVAFIGLDLLGASESFRGGGEGNRIANAGHLGGAAAGFLFKTFDLRLFSEKDDGPTLLDRLRRKLGRKPRLRVLPPTRDDPPPKRREPAPQRDADREERETRERVDELLRKINQDGLQSLTDEERRFLDQASARYKR